MTTTVSPVFTGIVDTSLMAGIRLNNFGLTEIPKGLGIPGSDQHALTGPTPWTTSGYTVVVIQAGYFVPNETGLHRFRLRKAQNAYPGYINDGPGIDTLEVLLYINGIKHISGKVTNEGDVVVSQDIPNLTANSPVSFVWAGALGIPTGQQNPPYRFTTFLDLEVNGVYRHFDQFQGQFRSVRDLASNPIFNANIVLQTLRSSSTPSFVAPLQDIIDTNILSNNSIATVPCPAIIPSVCTSTANTIAEPYVVPVPVPTKDPEKPVICYPPVIDAPPEVPQVPLPAIVTPPAPVYSGYTISVTGADGKVYDVPAPADRFAKSRYWKN